jgi:molecular chaperone DnaK
MEFNPGQTVGIDLGTTFSTVARVDDEGNPQTLPNEDGDIETPSVVLLAVSGHVIVGPPRSRAAMEDPQNVVARIKRFMGSEEYKRTFDGKEITPEFMSALILKKLRQDAVDRIGEVGNAVITVPYYFNDSRRKATQDAGRIAGMNVIDIIIEPTAATLTYAWKQGLLGRQDAETDEKPHQVLVYDLGGGTFDVTLVRYTPAHFQVLATDGDVELGGVDWTERIVDYVADEFQEKYDSNPRDSAATLQLMRSDCDSAKVQLTDEDTVSISCRHDGNSITVQISRDKFEEMTADLAQRTLDTVQLVLDQATMTVTDLDAIVLVGGSTLMPHIPRLLEQATGVVPYVDLSPFEAVAQGAAIHAAILEAKFRKDGEGVTDKVRKLFGGVEQEEVNSHGLGVTLRDREGRKRNKVMIRRNSQLPVEVKRTFATFEDGQTRVNVQVNEGEAPDPAACSLVGNCRITGLPDGLPKGSPIEVTYAFGADGRICVTACEKNGGKEATINIERKGSLSDKQIENFETLAGEYRVE